MEGEKMSGNRKAALGLFVMALAALTGFYGYAQLTGDVQGFEAGQWTALMLLVLAILSLVKFKV